MKKEYLASLLLLTSILLIGAACNKTEQETNTNQIINSRATITPTPSSNNNATQMVKLYFVALEDNGKSGEKIGCGDSLVSVDREIEKTQQPLYNTYKELLNIKDQYIGESGLYNALYQSTLSVESATIDENGVATIKLTGQLQLGGTCDSPRVEEQLTKTALQFSTVKSVEIFINNTPL
ncbi:MAG TPA: GerMN domain-containing protein, partial [Patescibacteria group bacterium]|nr:GerMN domain-containing protein [Patescibacteria group bacterium]